MEPAPALSWGFCWEAVMSDYLSADELADLVGCKPNQRMAMARWLDREKWKWVPDRNGLPRVARAYRDMKLGLANGSKKLEDAPNIDAFVASNRHSKAVQARRGA